MAMGTMMSEPRPLEVKTGRRARMVAAVVISGGRTRRMPACTESSRTSSTDETPFS